MKKIHYTLKNKFKNDLNKKIKKNKLLLTLFYSAFIFIILLLTLFLVGVILYFLIKYDLMPAIETTERDFFKTIFFIGIISLITGCAIGFGSNYYAISPLKTITSKMNLLASGEFNTRLKFSKPICYLPSYKNLEESFNTMAEELENTEMLRTDFINNFSHEFKTPIVSISGFAKLMQKENISDEEKKEYAKIIEKESLRLSFLATNILNLTKLENQNILTQVRKYNISEQIRECILIFEEKWRNKNIEIELKFDEFTVNANFDLMQNVFINLIDNAIKFTPEYGKIAITIDQAEALCISIINTGSTISPENINKIFNKFYQEDESHSSEGNGVGLAIVKKIIELHQGYIKAESKNSVTSFIIYLPNHN